MMSDISKRITNLSRAKLEVLAQRLGQQSRERAPGEVIRKRANPHAPVSLSFSQQRMWFLHQLEPGSAAFNISVAVRLSGHLDVSALQHSLAEIVRRHEALRTSFPLHDGAPVQLIAAPTVHWPLPLLDLSTLGAPDREAQLQGVAATAAEHAFDLAAGPVLRTTLVKLSAREHVLLLVMHHIVSDGWSMGVLVREVAALYQAYLEGRESPLPELPVQYADYAQWQREWLSGERLERQLSYWREQLSGAPPLLELPVDRARGAVLSYRGGTQRLELGAEVTAGLKALGRSSGATLFMVLLAGFKSLLYRYTGQAEIVVGTNIANRNHGQLEALIGCFVNNLVLRTDLSGNPPFREALARVREVTLAAYANQDVPYELIVEALRDGQGQRGAQLFQVMLVLQNNPMPPARLKGLELSFIPVGVEAAAFDLILYLSDSERGLVGHLQYDRDLFNASTVERMLARLQNLLRHIVADPDEHLSALSLTSSEETDALTESFNAAL
jgi:hypothetical protein